MEVKTKQKRAKITALVVLGCCTAASRLGCAIAAFDTVALVQQPAVHAWPDGIEGTACAVQSTVVEQAANITPQLPKAAEDLVSSQFVGATE